ECRYSEYMLNFLRIKPYAALAAMLLMPSWTVVAAQSVKYKVVSREVVESRLGRYAGNDKQREATLKQMFTEAGCDEQHISEQPVKGSKQPNIICVLPGSSDKVIIVGAHFDHISKGDGVVDNWSGASLLPSLYESLKIAPRKHTFIFIGFTDEEEGEVGSHFYVHQMTKEQVASTDAMVNMDTLGLAPTEIWGSHADKSLNSAIAFVAKQLHVPVTSVNVEQVGSTDSEQFAARKIPSITIHSLTQESWNAGILHTSKDKFSAIKLDEYYESYRLVAVYVAFLDQFAGGPEMQPKH
ncbi:MAG TPA: M28 family peptidase, partial [Candidatus Angelobacter sp.]|nr:M28 family peptidase [Candidatus Angelobacter sp.]